jgi:hypothetical protein
MSSAITHIRLTILLSSLLAFRLLWLSVLPFTQTQCHALARIADSDEAPPGQVFVVFLHGLGQTETVRGR